MKTDPIREVHRLESEIGQTRRRLDEYVDELDRRRHRLLSLREPARRGVGFAVGLAAAGLAAFILVRRRRPAARTSRKARDLRGALERVLSNPERVASDGKGLPARAFLAVLPIVARSLLAYATRRGQPGGAARRRRG